MKWDLHDAIDFCTKVEVIAAKHKFHTALTGGVLYKMKVPRKDLDIVFYSERQVRRPNRSKLIKALEKEFNLKLTSKFNWLQKAQTPEGRCIDFFFPETKKLANDEYPET